MPELDSYCLFIYIFLIRKGKKERNISKERIETE